MGPSAFCSRSQSRRRGRAEALHLLGSRAQGIRSPPGSVHLALDHAEQPGAQGFLLLSDAAIAGVPPCGFPLGFGELVIAVGRPDPLLAVSAGAWSGSALDVPLAIQPNPLLVDKRLIAQGVVLAPGSGEPVRLTNAVEIEMHRRRTGPFRV